MKAMMGLIAVATVLSLAPSEAQAQRHRSGNVNTPFGTFTMQEMMAGGGDPTVAADLKAQKLMMQQQQQYMAQMVKQQKAYADYIKKHPEAAKAARASTARLTPSPTRAAKKAKAKSGTAASTKAEATSTPAVAGAPPAAVKAKDADPE